MTRRARRRWLVAAMAWAVGVASLVGVLHTPGASVAAAASAGTRPGLTRFVYLAPSDRPFRSDYEAVLEGAVTQLQTWYAGQLGGATFRTRSQPVERCASPQPSSHFLADPWSKVTSELSRCVSWQYDDPAYRWVVYADVPQGCGGPGRIGAGVAGLAIMGEQDLQGLAGASPILDPCGADISAPVGRWIGGLGHELGHDLGLPHPPGCDVPDPTQPCDLDSLMYVGYLTWPATYFSPTERQTLSASPFIGDPGPWTADPPDTVGATGPADRGGSALAPDEIRVTWLAPFDDGGSAITAYRVATIPALPGGPTSVPAIADTSVVLHGAAPATSYTVSVEALNAAGASPPASAPSPVTIPATTTPPTTGPTPPTTGPTPPTTPPVSPPVEPPVEPPVTVATPHGYWTLAADGTVTAFGDVQAYPALTAFPGGDRAVDLAATPAGDGYWVVDDHGRVDARGRAAALGDLDPGALAPGESVSAISATPTGAGYWLFTTAGRAHAFGDAAPLGDLSGVALNGPVLGSVATPSGHGYFMVAADGGIFAFGDATFRGSMGGVALNSPVRSLVPTPSGGGYWLVAADGGVFAFGDAGYHGSIPGVLEPGQVLNAPICDMVAYGDGYLLAAEDGGVFDFSDRPFLGSLAAGPLASAITAVAVA